jgi:predicted phage-related endonuclease
MPRLTEAQLAAGADAVRASEVPMLLGLSPYGGAHALWQRKVEGGEERSEETLAQRLGHLLEPVTRELTAEREGVRITTNHRTRRHRTVPLVATPDGLFARGVFEGKARAYAREWGADGDPEGVPADVRVQVAAQQAVWNRELGIVGVLVGGSEPRSYRLERNRELEEAILESVVDLMARVARGEPPEPDGSDDATAWLRRRFPAETPGLEIVATAEQELLVDELQAASFEAIAAEARLERAKQRIQSVIGEAAALITPSGRITWTRNPDVPETSWQAVADAYRAIYRDLRDGADRRGLPVLDDEDLDTLISIHTRTRPGVRVFRHPFTRKAAERGAAA